MRKCCLLLLLTAAALQTGCEACKKTPPTLPDAFSLPVPLIMQQASQWCWAASGEMIMRFLGTSEDVRQCEQASDALQYILHSDCCTSPVPVECDVGYLPQFEYYGFSAQPTSGAPLEWQQIKDQIYVERKPWAITWEWKGGGAHMMVGIGYETVNGANHVTINDPSLIADPLGGGLKTRTYEAYVSGTDYTHGDDYYDITKK